MRSGGDDGGTAAAAASAPIIAPLESRISRHM